MTSKATVAVLGAGGTMGLPIARNLARDGFSVRAWNRSTAKAEPLREDGAEVLDSPQEAVAGAELLVTMLADADAVLETMGEALQGAGEDAVWLQMSTVGERGLERCLELARERDIDFVDAPVLGTKKPAEDAKLVVLAAAAQRLRDRVEPLFDAISQRTIWLDDPGDATRLKLATNSWVLTVVEGTAETVALAEGLGIDPKLVLEAVSGGTLDLPYLQMKAKAILERSLEPSFSLRLATKDARLIEESATQRDLDLPLLATIAKRFAEGVEEHGEKDMIATYFTSAPSGASAERD